ncbi:MAG TPA: Hpt domain-containing protein [Tepidisphaeraceae bacterium]
MVETHFIDYRQLLSRCLNDRDFMKQMLEIFSDFVPQTLANLQSAVDRKDVDAVRRLAHTLKGSAANVSAEVLRQVAMNVEQQAATGDLGAVRETLPQIDAALARSLADARSLLSEYCEASPNRPN